MYKRSYVQPCSVSSSSVTCDGCLFLTEQRLLAHSTGGEVTDGKCRRQCFGSNVLRSWEAEFLQIK